MDYYERKTQEYKNIIDENKPAYMQDVEFVKAFFSQDKRDHLESSSENLEWAEVQPTRISYLQSRYGARVFLDKKYLEKEDSWSSYQPIAVCIEVEGKSIADIASIATAFSAISRLMVKADGYIGDYALTYIYSGSEHLMLESPKWIQIGGYLVCYCYATFDLWGKYSYNAGKDWF